MAEQQRAGKRRLTDQQQQNGHALEVEQTQPQQLEQATGETIPEHCPRDEQHQHQHQHQSAPTPAEPPACLATAIPAAATAAAAAKADDGEEPVGGPASDIGASVDPAKVLRLLQKAETILSHRTDRLLLVLERPFITDNYLGCLRTAECLGVQNVWVVVQQRGYHKTDAPEAGSKQELKEFRKRVRLSRQSAQWLDVREFHTSADCIVALRQGGWTVWATDLSDGAVSLTDTQALAGALPAKLAIVMGREADGVTQEMLGAAEKRVYLPLVGFNTSLNLQVATGMVLQRLLSLWPSAQGDLSDARKADIRRDWYTKLARSEAQKSAFLAHLDSPPPPLADMRLVQ